MPPSAHLCSSDWHGRILLPYHQIDNLAYAHILSGSGVSLHSMTDAIASRRANVARVRQLEARVASCLGSAAVHASAAVEREQGYADMLEQLLRLLPPPPRVKFACSVLFGDSDLLSSTLRHSPPQPIISPTGTIISPSSLSPPLISQYILPLLPQAHVLSRSYKLSASSAAQVGFPPFIVTCLRVWDAFCSMRVAFLLQSSSHSQLLRDVSRSLQLENCFRLSSIFLHLSVHTFPNSRVLQRRSRTKPRFALTACYHSFPLISPV
jgi:hypothetical protein